MDLELPLLGSVNLCLPPLLLPEGEELTLRRHQERVGGCLLSLLSRGLWSWGGGADGREGGVSGEVGAGARRYCREVGHGYCRWRRGGSSGAVE